MTLEHIKQACRVAKIQQCTGNSCLLKTKTSLCSLLSLEGCFFHMNYATK